MRTRASLALAALLAVGACLGLGPTAQADPRPAFKVSVDRHVLHSGEAVTATATATTGCDWVLEWNGDRRVDRARTAVATWTAPRVPRPTRVPLHVTCFYSSGARPAGAAPPRTAGPGQRLTVTVPPSWRHTVVVTVLPAAVAVSAPGTAGGPGHPGGGLPGTGGPALWLLIAGVGAVLVGGAVVRVRPPRALPAR